MASLREEAKEMFISGFDSYMTFAFPKDAVRPLTCKGYNTQGGIALTLLDSLDALALFNESRRLEDAMRRLDADSVSFDVDEKVHVFELTIRALGGLLSTHLLLLRKPEICRSCGGRLLDLAVDLADRLLPAFDTQTGIPLSWVNLRHGVDAGITRVTCAACASTLLLEFGMLSHLTGNGEYAAKARHAVQSLYDMRSPLGLVGNTLHTDRGTWTRFDSGVGAGIDSYYEYLLKAYLLFGDQEYLDMFSESYTAAMQHLRMPGLTGGFAWLVDVNLRKGGITQPWVSSLSAFWPALQALAGQVGEARDMHANYTAAWRRFGWLPERFNLHANRAHPSERCYPLRPELIESTFLLFGLTQDHSFLQVARSLQRTLSQHNRAACGFAGTANVGGGSAAEDQSPAVVLEDSMESFFLSETVKYLWLLWSNATAITDAFVLTTEGHPFPPLPATKQHVKSPEERAGRLWHPSCRMLCRTPSQTDMQQSASSLRETMPLLDAREDEMALLRHRRCRACTHVASRMERVPVLSLEESARRLRIRFDGMPPPRADARASRAAQQMDDTTSTEVQVLGLVLCELEEVGGAEAEPRPESSGTCPEDGTADGSCAMPESRSGGSGALRCRSVWTVLGPLMLQTAARHSTPHTLTLKVVHVPPDEAACAAVLVEDAEGAERIHIDASRAVFGQQLPHGGVPLLDPPLPSIAALHPAGSAKDSATLDYEAPDASVEEDEYLDEDGDDSAAPQSQQQRPPLRQAGSQRPPGAAGPSAREPEAEDSRNPLLVKAPLAVADPPHACGGVAALHGAIALVDRGECSFTQKALNVEEAGGTGMVVVNLQGNGELFEMGMDESAQARGAAKAAARLRIPSVMVRAAPGLRLKQLLQRSRQPPTATLAGGCLPVGADPDSLHTHVQFEMAVATEAQAWISEILGRTGLEAVYQTAMQAFQHSSLLRTVFPHLKERLDADAAAAAAAAPTSASNPQGQSHEARQAPVPSAPPSAASVPQGVHWQLTDDLGWDEDW